MQCSCGGMTIEHTVTKDYKVIGIYEKCEGCGRICWIQKPLD